MTYDENVQGKHGKAKETHMHTIAYHYHGRGMLGQNKGLVPICGFISEFLYISLACSMVPLQRDEFHTSARSSQHTPHSSPLRARYWVSLCEFKHIFRLSHCSAVCNNTLHRPFVKGIHQPPVDSPHKGPLTDVFLMSA